jgi:TonB family protein
MNQALFGYVSLLGSAGLHLWLVLAGPAARVTPRSPVPPLVVSFSVSTANPPKEVTPPTPPPKVPTPEPQTVNKPQPPPKQQPQAPETPPAEELAAPDEAEVAKVPPELTGSTLLNTTGQGWAAPAGNGNVRQGAIQTGLRRGTAQATVKAVALRLPPAQVPPETLPLSQLSKKPVPPPLTKALERNYPTEARNLGRSGEAKVRARIEANGVVQSAKVSSETAPGFGAACRKTLLESKWSSPRDRNGKPVATWINYQCKFQIEG